MLKIFVEQFIKKIEEYQEIALFVHVQPDFDAYASAFSLKEWIEDNYENKKIYLMIPKNSFKGNDEILFQHEEWIPSSDELLNAIAIVLDTPTYERILLQQNIINCKEIITIDHHPKTSTFAHLEFNDPTYPANAQILAEIFFFLEETKEMSFNSKIAQYLYAGILTDTNNLMSLSIIPSTHNVISKLIYKGINRNKVHNTIFVQSMHQKLFNNHVIAKSQITKHGLAFSIISKYAVKKYEMQECPNVVNNLANINGCEAWSALMYDFELKKWKCSIRSKDLQINNIARKFGGGGHKNMAAVVLKRKIDYYKLLYTIDYYLKTSGFKNSSKKLRFRKPYIYEIICFYFKYILKDKFLN